MGTYAVSVTRIPGSVRPTQRAPRFCCGYPYSVPAGIAEIMMQYIAGSMPKGEPGAGVQFEPGTPGLFALVPQDPHRPGTWAHDRPAARCCAWHMGSNASRNQWDAGACREASVLPERRCSETEMRSYHPHPAPKPDFQQSNRVAERTL